MCIFKHFLTFGFYNMFKAVLYIAFPGPGVTHFSMEPCFFARVVFKIKARVLGVLITTGVSLLLGVSADIKQIMCVYEPMYIHIGLCRWLYW